MVDKLKNRVILLMGVIAIGMMNTNFAQSNEDRVISPSTQVPPESPTKYSEKSSVQDRFDEVLTASKSVCGKRFPIPLASNTSPYETSNTQKCTRLELTGKRIECEINYLGEQNAKFKIFGTESQTALKEWARCSGKVAVLLEEGYYVPSAEIDRRIKFCIFQFYKHPGDAPQLGLVDRLRKSFARPDYRDTTPDTIDKSYFDKSSIRIDDQTGGLLKCQYMLPPETPPRQIVVPEIVQVPQDALESRRTPARPEVRMPAPKKPEIEVKKITPAVVKKPEPIKDQPPVGECRRPKHDCPK